MNIILTILILGIIVFIHELGHFTTAKYFNMPVSEFAIGLGPKIISKKRKETQYSIRALPLGGYVKIEGMEIDEETPVENGFNSQKPWKRFIVLVAGVTMNFLSAIFIFFIIGTTPLNELKPIVGNVMTDSLNYNIIKPNDEIVSIDGENISSWEDLQNKLKSINSTTDIVELNTVVVRDGKEEELLLKLKYNEELKSYLIGIAPKSEKPKLLNRIKYSFQTFFKTIDMMFDGLIQLVTGKVDTKDVAGPIGLVKHVGNSYSSAGIAGIIGLFVLLSINIGLINLLPIPALDGGRIVFVILEMFGVKLNKKLEERVHFIGMLFLFGLMALIIFNDIGNLM